MKKQTMTVELARCELDSLGITNDHLSDKAVLRVAKFGVRCSNATINKQARKDEVEAKDALREAVGGSSIFATARKINSTVAKLSSATFNAVNHMLDAKVEENQMLKAQAIANAEDIEVED